MKTLLIGYYWLPYNNSGTFRWTGFGRHIDFDVLTCRRPLKSKLDECIQTRDRCCSVYKFGGFFPAIVWGLMAPLFVFIAPYFSSFKKYDAYVITSPPESLILGAWFLQLLGKNVVVDLRDSIDRERQVWKIFIPVYRFFCGLIRRKTCAYQFIDKSATVVYTGHEPVDPVEFMGYYMERVSYGEFMRRLYLGYIPTQRNKPSGYGSGSSQTYRHLGFPLDNNFHPEVYDHELISIKASSDKMARILKSTLV